MEGRDQEAGWRQREAFGEGWEQSRGVSHSMRRKGFEGLHASIFDRCCSLHGSFGEPIGSCTVQAFSEYPWTLRAALADVRLVAC
jgi:hypothetical protein